MVIWKNKWGYELHEDQTERGVYNYVKNSKGFVAILAGDDEEGFMSVENFRYPVQERILEIPMGYLDEGETPIHAARREFLEETGMKAKFWESLGTYYPMPGFVNMECHLFYAYDLKKVTDDTDKEEGLTNIKRVPREELLKARDLISKAALILYDKKMS